MNKMREEFEAWWNGCGYNNVGANAAWVAWKAARQPGTMDDALAAGDGTLHGAIDHWQERALHAEAELSARQPVGEVVAWFTWTRNHMSLRLSEDREELARRAVKENADMDQRGVSECFRIEGPFPLYAAPPQQPERVDWGAVKHAAHEWANLSACAAAKIGGSWRARKAASTSRESAKKRFLALINQQESKP